MLKLFTRYASVGVINTALHWIAFAVIFYAWPSQTIANLIAFCIAVTFSFFANAKWTFDAKATTTRYAMYVLFMGALAAAIGWLADAIKLNPLITLISFSTVSLICGFVYSHYIVFMDRK